MLIFFSNISVISYCYTLYCSLLCPKYRISFHYFYSYHYGEISVLLPRFNYVYTHFAHTTFLLAADSVFSILSVETRFLSNFLKIEKLITYLHFSEIHMSYHSRVRANIKNSSYIQPTSNSVYTMLWAQCVKCCVYNSMFKFSCSYRVFLMHKDCKYMVCNAFYRFFDTVNVMDSI